MTNAPRPAEACLETESCPTCRVAVSGTNPNFYARESIGSMQVKCPNGEDNDDRSKRRRGDTGNVVPAETCEWTGSCDDLEKHDSTCQFKVVRCELDGCYHECQRKDMARHLSGGGFLRHMNLMKQSITASYAQKIEDLEQHIEALKDFYNEKIIEMELKLSSSDEKAQYIQMQVARLFPEEERCFGIPGLSIEMVREKVKNVVENGNPAEISVMDIRNMLEEWLDEDLSAHRETVRYFILEALGQTGQCYLA